jgi:hypothetical protein
MSATHTTPPVLTVVYTGQQKAIKLEATSYRTFRVLISTHACKLKLVQKQIKSFMSERSCDNNRAMFAQGDTPVQPFSPSRDREATERMGI